jgi:hypothetical protein
VGGDRRVLLLRPDEAERRQGASLGGAAWDKGAQRCLSTEGSTAAGGDPHG